MKKLLAFLTVAVMFAFTACNGGGDDTDNGGGGELTITATNVKSVYSASDDEVVKVAAILWSEESETEEAHFTIATADYINHGFTITLPVPTVDMLGSLPAVPESVNISDPTAKCAILHYFRGLDADDKHLNVFYMANYTQGHTVEASYIYVDKNVNMIGSYTIAEGDYEYRMIFDLKLKKGWNVFYEYENENGDISWTTTLPAGSTMEWCYGY